MAIETRIEWLYSNTEISKTLHKYFELLNIDNSDIFKQI